MFLLIAGLALAQASRFWTTRRGLVTACVMVAVHLASGLLLLGFVVGWIVHAILPAEEEPHRSEGAAAGLSASSRTAADGASDAR